MSDSRRSCRWLRRRLIPAVAGLVLPFVGACPGERQVPATPAPPFSERVETVARDTILAYASRLGFDTSVAASDAQHLLLRRGDATVVGPFVQIAPERGAGSLSEAQLASGRIIARVSASDSYPPLGFPRGVSYLWVDSAPSGLRWVIVPTDRAERLRTVPLGYRRDSPAATDICWHARSLWVWYSDLRAPTVGPTSSVAAGVVPWVRCTCYGCCCYGGPCRETTINPTGEFVPPPSEWPRPELIGPP